jgi:hypothetical protein
MRPHAARQGPIAAPVGAGSVERAIARAARATEIDFGFLVAQAEVESAMDPHARARTSSATGLYQFIESTWLETMQRHGPRFGMAELAARISTTPGGSAHVPDPAQREAILALRRDPEVAALMAAGLAEDNRAHLMPILGRQPDNGELYLAHFLGAGGAARFLTELARDPSQEAASLFGRPAAANRAVFYDAGGDPRSLAEVMDHLSTKIERATAGATPQPALAAWAANARGFGPAPYLAPDDSVFDLAHAPAIGPTHPMPDHGPVSLPRAHSGGAHRGTPPMSSVLSATFGDGAASLGSAEANAQARRAYDRLRALGL